MKIVAALFLAVIALAGCSAGTKTVAGPTVTTTATKTIAVTVAPTATVTTTFTPTPAIQVGSGIYLVPSEIQPGIWHTDNTSADHCYYERDNNLSGGVGSIIKNGNITGPASIQIDATDKAVTFTGSCMWAKTG